MLDPHDPVVLHRAAERGHRALLVGLDRHLGRLRELELAEGLLELAPDAVERRAQVGRDHRPDELERQADGAGLERVSLGGRRKTSP